MTDLVLHMFPSSHYNEKARWALDWKALPHRRMPYLPGPHAPQIKRLSGQSQVPVLEMDGRVIPGSARMVDELERAHPERALYPPDPAVRERALEVQRRFDDEVGPAVRTAVFSVMIDELDYLCATFARKQPLVKRTGYRALLPVVKPLIAKANGLDPDNVARALARVAQALDETARMVEATGQVVGERFSVADLTVAALLAPLAELEHPDMARPPSVPERMAAFYTGYATHPAIAWVRAQYARHRPASCEASS